MAKAQPPSIRLRGVRQNNLKGFDLDLPLRRLIVVTGPSGSGKSSLAFDTLFAEGQRRYVETFSPYARQFFDRMDKPRTDSIEGIPPAIAIEQRNSVRTTRSTVGTMTELCDHLKLLWPHLAELHCRSCGRRVQPDTPASIWAALPRNEEILINFDLPLSEKLSLEESLALVERQGYQRLLIHDRPTRLEEAEAALKHTHTTALVVVQDRIRVEPGRRSRFAEACEQAYHFGKGRLTIRWTSANQPVVRHFSKRLHCAECDLEYQPPTSALFSFNHPLGACPTCRGFGRTIAIDYDRVLPDRSVSLRDGVVRPWQTGMSAECQQDLMRFCRTSGIPVDIPFADLSEQYQRLVIEGEPDYGKDKQHEWPRAWYGVKGYFRWLESKAYKMHVRVLLSRYRTYTTCPSCSGQRLQPAALDFKLRLPPEIPSRDPLSPNPPDRLLTLAGFYQLTVRDALKTVTSLKTQSRSALTQALALVLDEIEARLGYLDEVGLGYLTLDRPTRSLSGGETERVNLTTCLGTRLVNTLYVLDEPSVGLHARDTDRLVRILERMRDVGNTVVVVEHEPAVMRAADQIIDLGPGHGEQGGHLVFQGTVRALLSSRASLTGAYLSGRKVVPGSRHRPVDAHHCAWLQITNATRNNLQALNVALPVGRLVCVTGVSGSGKSTLVRDVLHPLLNQHLAPATHPTSHQPDPSTDEPDNPDSPSPSPTHTAKLQGWEVFTQSVLVDQSAIGRTPRSNPAVYVGAFDSIRDLFAASEEARRRGLNKGAFSFNSREGQCERCRGAGFEKIEMQFLSDVFIRCPECNGRRYRPHILEVKLQPPDPSRQPHKQHNKSPRQTRARRREGWHIAHLLEAPVDDAITFLGQFPHPAASRATTALGWLREVGLGYLRLGQPINTLSGGESQRLKLVGALVEADRNTRSKPTIYLLDEPTTGLHFDDVRVLLDALQKLIDAGHSAVVIEHNLEVIQAADWVIDLGPEAGRNGGRTVVAGTPDDVAACHHSHTGAALRSRNKVLPVPRTVQH